MTRLFINSAALVTTLLVGVSCSPEPPADAAGEDMSTAPAETSGTGATLEAAEALGLSNARMPLPNLVTAGQPTVEQLDALADAGYRHFISLRPSQERGAGWEEEHAIGRPFEFERLPISGREALNRDNVEAFAALLESVGDQPTVLYCGSSNRVGAMLALKAFWVDGAEADAAFELGQNAGMTGLSDPVKELLGLAGGN